MTGAMKTAHGEQKPLRILAWPMSRNASHNPYTSLLYSAIEAEGAQCHEFSVSRALFSGYDVLHVHWPEGVLSGRGVVVQSLASVAQAVLLVYVRYVRRRPVVWTVHNASPHASVSAAALWMVRAGLRASLTGLIFLSHASGSIVREEMPWTATIESVVTPHGRYAGTYPTPEARDEVRRRLNVTDDERLVVFVGRMHEYKGPLELAKVGEQLADQNIRVLLAGEIPEGPYGEELRASVRESRILLVEGWLSPKDMASYLNAGDLAVYPYRDILNSGSVILPLEYSTPVLCPNIGSLVELAGVVGRDWLRTYDGALSPQALSSALCIEPSCPPNLDALGWRPIARSTIRFLRGQLSLVGVER